MTKYKVIVAEHFTHYREVEVEVNNESEVYQEVNDMIHDAPCMEDLEWADDEIISIEEIDKI